MQGASAEALKFETLSRWASTTEAELEFSSELTRGATVRPKPEGPSPEHDPSPPRTQSARDQSHATVYEARLANDGALHPTISIGQRAFSVPAPPHDGIEGDDAAVGQQSSKEVSNARRRSPDPLWGGVGRPLVHRSQSRQASPPPRSWLAGDLTMQGNRLAARMDAIHQENERLAVEEASRQPFGSLPTTSQYSATAAAVQARQPAPAEYASRERATQQSSLQSRALDYSERLELERLRQRTHELEMNFQSSCVQVGTVHAELDQQRRAAAAAEERAGRLQAKLDKERQAVQRLTSRPIPVSPSPGMDPPNAPDEHHRKISPTRSLGELSTSEELRTRGSPFEAAREELTMLQHTTARFSDTENDLAKSVGRIAELEQTIRDRDAELARKDQLLREKEELVRRHEELLRDRDHRLAQLARGMRQLLHEAEPQQNE